MGEERELQEVLERHRAFWERGETDGPLVMEERPWVGLSDRIVEVPLVGGGLVPEGAKLDPSRIDVVAYAERHEVPGSLFAGGTFQVFRPPDLCWTEAIMGCDVYLDAGCRWTTPFLEDLGGLEGSSYGRENLWFGKLLEFTEALVDKAAGRFPVGEPLMRGPIDMLRAMLGDNAMCLAFYDEPERAQKLVRICADVFLRCLQAQLELIPEFHRGYVSHFDIWAPGTVGYCQLDASVLLSPQDFRCYFLEEYRRVADSFDYPVFHIHSGCLRHTEALLELEGLRAVQVSIDPVPFGPPLEEMMPVFQRIQEVKPLIITSGPIGREERDKILETLSPRGLCVGVKVYEEGQDLYSP